MDLLWVSYGSPIEFRMYHPVPKIIQLVHASPMLGIPNFRAPRHQLLPEEVVGAAGATTRTTRQVDDVYFATPGGNGNQIPYREKSSREGPGPLMSLASWGPRDHKRSTDPKKL